MERPSFIGIDVVEIPRFRRFCRAASSEQLSRIFTERERRDVAGRAAPEAGLAARFAAKEAVMKVLEDVDPFALDWREIEITRGPGGRPRVQLRGATAALAAERGIERLEVSMSHSKTIAIAQAVSF
jgi:holo-[acyl-carrier protein] synthase